MPNTATLISEFAPKRHRSHMVTFIYCGFTLGAALGGLGSEAMIEHFGWRSVLIAGGVLPIAFALLLVLTLPESIRFLAQNGAMKAHLIEAVNKIAPGLANHETQFYSSEQTVKSSGKVAAITKHRLMSLSNAKREMDTGLDRIIAKEVSELAFNHTHICPFNNTCPKEVIDLFGEVNCCSACPYAIRGVAHLPAVSARKDKYKELMVGSLKVIERYLTRKPEARTRTELEQLEQENDRFAREACLLEAIEHQLVQMYESGLDQELMVKNKEEIVVHYSKLDLPGEERLLKRLIDVQNFPDTSSEDLNIRLSHLRHALLMREGNLSALLGIGEDNSLPLASKVALQISSMVKSGAIDVFELYAASTGEHEAIKRLATVANDAPKLIQMVA